MPVRNPRTLIIGAALALTTGFGSVAAAPSKAPAKAAKGPATPPAAAKSKLDTAALQKALESGDEAQVLKALDTIQNSGDAAGAPLVEGVLARGANAAVLGRAIETLNVLAQPSSGAALAPYTQHRTAEIRHAALRALIATKSPLAGDVLRRALHGSDPAQRSIAARGLGELNVRAAVPELISALSHDVPEAAQSIGQLCVGPECEQFTGLLGRLRFEVMESGIVPLLLRPQADASDDLKLKLIERLRRMATQPANQIIQAALTKFPADGSPAVKKGLERALKGFSATGEEDK